MNLVNLFVNKTKEPEPEYFLAIEVHESLIKTALWEVLDGEPSVVNVGSFESWADEESLINGVDASLEQAIKVIKDQPRRVILGLPDSWMDKDGIHPTKDKLIKRLIKELNLEPIGMVPINSAISHYLKKREGIPPTAILLEVYSSKVAVSYIDRGEVKFTEEVSKSGDLARDVEEGLTGMDVPNFPARFILTNGGALEDEQQQITAYQWQEKLSFVHIPKVEVLPVDFSITAIALAGGAEAVRFIGIDLKQEIESPVTNTDEKSNIVVPDEKPATMAELGFSYEETDAPDFVPKENIEMVSDMGQTTDNPSEASTFHEYAVPEATTPSTVIKLSRPKFSLPKFPTLRLPRFSASKKSLIFFILLPVFMLAAAIGAYFAFGSSEIIILFKPQKLTQKFDVAISETNQEGVTTLIATKKTVTGAATESIATSGDATVGEKATGTVTIFNRSVAPLALKAGTIIGSENGKFNFTISEAITVASKSADLLSGSEVFGKAEGVKVNANKIGADYNFSKSSQFTVDNYSKTVSYAVADSDFTGGTSRVVKAVSKADQDKLYALAVEKIKTQTQQELQSQSPGTKILTLTDLQFTKKKFDKNVGEEANTLNLELEGSLDTLLYADDALFNLANEQLQKILPVGMSISKENTRVVLENPTKTNFYYLAKASAEADLQPVVDENKSISMIRGKNVASVREFFNYVVGFSGVRVRISPPIPILSEFVPLNNIKFTLSPL